jgi:hypothetical protein
MDPSRIRLEDDRFGLIGASFRPGNRAEYIGRSGEDHAWSVGIYVGAEDDIQTVEIDDHGAKSSRMLTNGELFEGLEVLALPGPEAFLLVGTFTLMGMELTAAGNGTPHDFAEILRAAADDHSWRLPLHLVGHPRDLQLSVQGRDILRQTAAALEDAGHAMTSLSAARRLELSEQALDSVRRRVSRKSLQAYRMHGRWYVVLDNLARSRAAAEAPLASESPVEEVSPDAAAPVQSDEAIAPMTEAEPELVVEEEESAAEAVAVETEAAPEPVVYEEVAEPESDAVIDEQPIETVSEDAAAVDDLAEFAEPETEEPAAAAEEVADSEPITEPSVEYVTSESSPEVEEDETPLVAEDLATTVAGESLTDAAQGYEPVIDEGAEDVAAETSEAEASAEASSDDATELISESETEPDISTGTADDYRAAASSVPVSSESMVDEETVEPETIGEDISAESTELAAEQIDTEELEEETPIAAEADVDDAQAAVEEIRSEEAVAEADEIPVEEAAETADETTAEFEPEVDQAPIMDDQMLVEPDFTVEAEPAFEAEAASENSDAELTEPEAELAAEDASTESTLTSTDSVVDDAEFAADEPMTEGDVLDSASDDEIAAGESEADATAADVERDVEETLPETDVDEEGITEVAPIDEVVVATEVLVETVVVTEMPDTVQSEEEILANEIGELASEVEAPETSVDEILATEQATGIASAQHREEAAADSDTVEPSESIEAEPIEQSDELISESTSEPATTEVEASPDVSDAAAAIDDDTGPEAGVTVERSDELIGESVAPQANVTEFLDEAGEPVIEDVELPSAPDSSDEMETHADDSFDDVSDAAGATRDADEELIDQGADSAESDADANTGSAAYVDDAAANDASVSGGQSTTTFFANAKAAHRETTSAPQPSATPADVDLSTHLRGEVAYLRQQSREKDRQIGVWGEGAKWLQPFVDQIRSLEKQVERLGELQVQRDNDRIADLMSERDLLRERLATLETEIMAAQSTDNQSPKPIHRRSWFQRMMGSE